MSVRVTAPLVVAPDAAGLLRYRYRGAVLGVDDIDAEAAARLLDDGLIEPVDTGLVLVDDEDPGDDEQPVDGDQGDGEGQADEQPAAVPARPLKAAPKDAWVAYAVSRGMTEAEADAMTRAELVAKFAGA
ncbi:hypothetical protein [Nocardia sp. CA-145437]|uniref:hypothetical protein n=1 Tax=Nocardia sp. CA-145437 TaxID=3239980 RepID=UPI003D96E8C6